MTVQKKTEQSTTNVEDSQRSVAKKPDKKVVVGEDFSDQALRGFLTAPSVGSEPADFTRLRVAYQSLPVSAFERFLAIVAEQSLPINPQNGLGRSFLSFLECHPAQAAYAEVLRQKLMSNGL